MKLLLRLVLLLALGAMGMTWWSLESYGVATLETKAADGSTRSTHVWFAEDDGQLWLEAGTPENAWYIDVQKQAVVMLSTDDRSGRYVARTMPGEEARLRVRSLLREKYGIRDWWINLVFDTSRSIAVRLIPR